MSKLFPIHARTVTGLEEVLAEELFALGATDIQLKNRLVICSGDQSLLYKANIWCRTAIRVLRPIAAFPARDEKALYEGVRSIDWSQWVKVTGTLAVDSDVRSSFTTHSLYISQLAKDAVVDQFRDKTGERPSVDLNAPDLRIVVSLFQDGAQVYADSSGESLHKRGYRTKAGEAPISETLAAGILKLSGWDAKTPLVDAMTGSGTFCIEAGLFLRNIAPGLLRKQFGFQKWLDYDKSLFENLIGEAKKSIRKEATLPIIGLEIDPEVAAIARENVERAGLTDLIKIENGDFFTWEGFPKTPGTLVMNPPYDERLTINNVENFYQRIGDKLKSSYAGWTANVLSGNLEAVKSIGLRSSKRTVLFNGSIESRLLQYELRAAVKSTDSPSAGPRWREQEVEVPAKWKDKVDVFTNRLKKNVKKYSKWAEREKITAWRLYDWDIPELPFIIDVYGDALHFVEIQRNMERSPSEQASYMKFIMKAAADVMGFARENIFYKMRAPQATGGFQNTPDAATGKFTEVGEGGHRFLVNLSDYLDTGLNLNQRKMRALIEKESAGKDFLNLFSYTGSLSVYAAAGGAKSTTSVDTSRIYLEWAEKNLKLNGFSGEAHTFFREDTIEFLQQTQLSFDLCVVDPPARSVNRVSGNIFDVQSDHLPLLRLVLDKMRPGGRVFFLTNYRSFEIEEKELMAGHGVTVREITAQTIPLDFDRKPSHRCWVIEANPDT